jgi:phosphatidylethanolamine/phosphatidyl-N-methylethanolamine N-methyltransferase
MELPVASAEESCTMPVAKSAKSRKRPINGVLAFLSQAIKETRTTGAVLPSSRGLAKAMTRSLIDAKGAKRLLEVGPGTGPFTREILKTLRDGDELHIVEINPIFAHRLETVLLEPFRKKNPKIRIEMHVHAIESAPLKGPFDYIICGLPFNNFSPELVRSIFRRLLEMLKDGGELAYFEYAGVRVFKSSIVGEKGRKELKSISAMGKVLRKRHRGERELVLGNVPPAVAVRLRR